MAGDLDEIDRELAPAVKALLHSGTAQDSSPGPDRRLRDCREPHSKPMPGRRCAGSRRAPTRPGLPAAARLVKCAT